MRIAFLGLGNMGSGMAARLATAGHTLSVFNRTAARAEKLAIKHAVGLRSRGANRVTFRRIQPAKLGASLVGGQSHRPVQGVDFLHEVAFANAADGGVARHLTQGLDTVREEQRTTPQARSC